jgi:hypothetical protein
MEAHSFICSLGEFGEEQDDENGSIGRGEIGCHLSWRAQGGLRHVYFVVRVLVWWRAHSWRRAQA